MWVLRRERVAPRSYLRIAVEAWTVARPEQLVHVTWTAFRFGGSRPLIECPGCGSRRVRLYREWRGGFY
jgi:hypothetical protein